MDVNTENLVTKAMIANLLGVQPSAVSNWIKRHSDFPRPIFWLGEIAVFDLREVLAWNVGRN